MRFWVYEHRLTISLMLTLLRVDREGLDWQFWSPLQSNIFDFLKIGKRYTPFFYKQSIFDPRPENCSSFSKKWPQKIV